MTFTDYSRSSLHLRQQLARTNGLTFYLFETGRYAAVMALVLAIGDLSPWPYRLGQPTGRLGFIVVWSLVMAGLSFWRERRRKPQAPAPITPA